MALNGSSALAEPRLQDYYGRWEILIANSASSFRSGFLLLEGEGGAPKGELVWRWGSVYPLGRDAVSLSPHGELLVKSGHSKKPLVLRRVGDAVEGYQEEEKEKFIVIGTPGSFDVNPNGVWEVVAEPVDGSRSGRLVLDDQGGGLLRGKAFSETGDEIKLENLALKTGPRAGVLSFDFETRAGDRIHFSGELRGDRLAGKAEPAGGGDIIPIKGTRQRQWGSPVTLLAQQGLAGWHARQESKSFGWKCEEGVLTNGEHDVDLVSDAEFKDFKLSLEYKIVKGGNSGIYLRGRYEVQILDHHDAPNQHTNGAVYSRIAPCANATGEPETWQKYEIALTGRYVTVALNGKTIVDNERLDGITGGAQLPFESRPGPLMLQGDHGKVWFRNIVVTPALPPAAH
ncbi:MAG: DUF1080 domain-containing protein [Planctomycetes bacterium]|nr:DUF1080 domain-containing protein [Planctomycetota bacterium]